MIAEIDLSSEQAKKKQFFCIDLVKLICAVLVVAIHVQPLEDVNLFINYGLVHYIARVAVPFYFVTSGYFLFRKINPECFDKNITLLYTQRIWKLYLSWTGIYSVPIIYYIILKGKSGIVSGILDAIRIIFLVGYGQLWYLHATVVAVLAITFLISHKFNVKKIVILGACLYAIGLLAQSWFWVIKPLQNIDAVWASLKVVRNIISTTRNGIFEGILFMSIGMLFAYKKIVMKFRYAVIGFCVSMIFLCGEVFVVKYFYLYLDRDMYIFLVPVVLFLFYIISHIELRESGVFKQLRVMGFLIYLVHMWINKPVMELVNKFMVTHYGVEIHSFVRFLLVLGLSFVVAVLIMWLSKKRRWVWLRKLY